MQFRPLADTGILVPEICLGTMTFGEQNTQEEAFQQLDYALEQGLYFWDTAEMYPVPPSRKPKVQLNASLVTGLLHGVVVTNCFSFENCGSVTRWEPYP